MQPDTTLPKATTIKKLLGIITQGPTGSEITAGPLTINETYIITDFHTSDDFNNIVGDGAGTPNTTGFIFKASGTTPTNWTHGSIVKKFKTTLIEQHNTIGTITATPDGTWKTIELTGTGLFPQLKTNIQASVDYYNAAGAISVQPGQANTNTIWLVTSSIVGDVDNIGRIYFKIEITQ